MKKYYKNGSRFTAIKNKDGFFVQVLLLKTASSLTSGINRFIIEDVKYDVEIEEEEFIDAYLQCLQQCMNDEP